MFTETWKNMRQEDRVRFRQELEKNNVDASILLEEEYVLNILGVLSSFEKNSSPIPYVKRLLLKYVESIKNNRSKILEFSRHVPFGEHEQVTDEDVKKLDTHQACHLYTTFVSQYIDNMEEDSFFL